MMTNTPDTPAVKTKKNNAITLFVPNSRLPIVNRLDEIASGLRTSRNTLIWHLIEACCQEGGPNEIRVTGIGSGPGFWIIHKTDDSGKLVAVEVREVVARSQIEGFTFYRYKKGDSKVRERAMRAAKNAADTQAKLVGLAKSGITITELSGADLQAVLSSPSVVETVSIDDAKDIGVKSPVISKPTKKVKK